MAYSTTTSAHKLNHGDIYDDASTGISTEVIANAFNMVKARIEAAGLTPPGSSTILAVAENFYIKAELLWKGRMMGDLPSGQGAMSTYDNVNRSYAMFMKLGDDKVDQYIASAGTGVHPSDVDGTVRVDAPYDEDGVARPNNFKLDQGVINEF